MMSRGGNLSGNGKRGDILTGNRDSLLTVHGQERDGVLTAYGQVRWCPN